jgi:uncharacterized membrane protein
MLSSTNFWMCFAGLVYLVAGVFIVRKELSVARGWDKLITLGCVFVAASLAVFAAEHFRGATFLKFLVPPWMPARLFWAYFVGFALISAATSLTARKFARLSSTLLGVMFLLFVLMIHLPNVAAHPKDRIIWAVALRDLSFSGGAWALAGMLAEKSSPQQSKWMVLFGRVVVGLAVIFFAVEHFLHPEFAPGVPLQKMTPAWVPLPIAWGYLAGAILVAAGIGLVINKKSRMAAASIGMMMTVLTLFLYLPILILARGGSTPQISEAINYVADTLLFAGTALVLASTLPRDREERA